jgi:hypothetical protein
MTTRVDDYDYDDDDDDDDDTTCLRINLLSYRIKSHFTFVSVIISKV